MQSLSLASAMQSLFGGFLIGGAAWLLLAALGRVAGISGIASSLLPLGAGAQDDRTWRWAFMLSLVAAGGLASMLLGVPDINAQQPELQNRSPLLLISAGLLVGFGTITGAGCTSGHGICGLGRRSLRSLVATLSFMAAGFATATLIHIL